MLKTLAGLSDEKVKLIARSASYRILVEGHYLVSGSTYNIIGGRPLNDWKIEDSLLRISKKLPDNRVSAGTPFPLFHPLTHLLPAQSTWADPPLSPEATEQRKEFI